MALYLSDIFKIFYNYEPSRSKLWEIVRSFDYMEIGKLIFLLENIKRDTKRQPILLNNNQIVKFLLEPKVGNNPKYYYDDDDIDDKDDMCNIYNTLFKNNPNYNKILGLNLKPTLRIERVYNTTRHLIWNSIVDDNEKINHDDCVETMTSILKNTNELQRHHRLDETIDYLMNLLRNGHNIDSETNIYASILMHNFGTSYYGSFVMNIESLLLPENLQFDRNEMSQKISVAKRFLEYYKMLIERQTLNADAKTLRFVMVPQSQRIIEKEELLTAPNQLGDYAFQPFYHGFHLVVYASHQETRCYNRYGDLMHNVAYNMQIPLNCTFEGVLLPIDGRERIRSWRYWPYRRSYIIYIVDVYRYEQILLLNAPFKERSKYIDKILKTLHTNRDILKDKCFTMNKVLRKNTDDVDVDDGNDDKTILTVDNLKLDIKAHKKIVGKESKYKELQHYYNALKNNLNTLKVLQKIPENLQTWTAIEERYGRNVDIFDPIIGVVARKIHNTQLDHQYYKFNIKYLYDLVNHTIKPLQSSEDLKCINPETTFINFEMVDYMQISLMYGHCSQYLYICEYNRDIHQFVHRVKIKRLPYDTYDSNFNYKPESVYVVNNQMESGLSSGLAYIRLYYDVLHQVVGYENKWTDCRYKIPYDTSIVYDNFKNK